LVVDDESGSGHLVIDVLRQHGIAAEIEPDLGGAYRRLREQPLRVAIVSASSPAIFTAKVMHEIASRHPMKKVIFVNPGADVETTASLLRAGAFHVLSGRELSVDELVDTVRSALKQNLPDADFDELCDLSYREAKERALETFERKYFSVLLSRTSGNVSEAARQAGLDRSNFRRALRRARLRASTNGEGSSDEGEVGPVEDPDSVSRRAASPRPLVRGDRGISGGTVEESSLEFSGLSRERPPQKWATGH
jgi:DNA-binding NtrC family response regulator